MKRNSETPPKNLADAKKSMEELATGFPKASKVALEALAHLCGSLNEWMYEWIVIKVMQQPNTNADILCCKFPDFCSQSNKNLFHPWHPKE